MLRVAETLGAGGAAPTKPGLEEERLEQRGGHPVATSHRPHLSAAVAWLTQAQDATRSGGIARGYSFARDAESHTRGWQPPEAATAGSVIVALAVAAQHLQKSDLAERALRAAEWLQAQPRRSTTLDASRSALALHAWLGVREVCGNEWLLDAARIAVRDLLVALSLEHNRRKGLVVRRTSCLLRARWAWALAAAGEQLEDPSLTMAASAQLKTVVAEQNDDGWFRAGSSSGHSLAVVADAIRGILECAVLLDDRAAVDRAALAASSVASAMRHGHLPGRFAEGWRPAASWTCLEGQAALSSVWWRLHEVTRDPHWLDAAGTALRFLKHTQNRLSPDLGLRGGIKQAAPFGSGEAPYHVSAAATAAFVGALINAERIQGATGETASPTSPSAPLITPVEGHGRPALAAARATAVRIQTAHRAGRAWPVRSLMFATAFAAAAGLVAVPGRAGTGEQITWTATVAAPVSVVPPAVSERRASGDRPSRANMIERLSSADTQVNVRAAATGRAGTLTMDTVVIDKPVRHKRSAGSRHP